MERDSVKRNSKGGDSSLLLRSTNPDKTTTSEFVLQWGNRKRLRCMKIQVKDDSNGVPVTRTTVRVDRRVVRYDKDQRPSSPIQRVLRNSENLSASVMRPHESNGGAATTRATVLSPEKTDKNTKSTGHHHQHVDNHKSAASSDSEKGGSSSGSGDSQPAMVWPPKFVIALTNKEKEEDFLALKGSKLPQRPKKRAKFIQRTVNLVSPGAWLCDLTLERYEVREKKISKKRPRGLKAMGTMVESDSE